MFKFINFCMAAMAIAFAGHAQQPFSGSPAGTDTSSFDYLSRKKLQQELAGADSSLHARITKLHGRWDWFWRPRVSPGSGGSGIFAPVVRAINHAMRQPPFCPTNTYRGNWSYFGPDHDYFNKSADSAGRVISLWVSPTNPDSILAGAVSGGLWRTVNGGRTWANITDEIAGNPKLPGTMGITDIAVHPDHRNTIFLSTGVYGGAVNYGMGVVYSYDGGASWHIDENYRNAVGSNTTWGFETSAHLLKLAFSPYSKRLYAIVGKKILMKTTPAASAWQDITPTSSAAFNNADCKFADFEFTRNPDGEVFFSTAGPNNTQYLLTYKESNHDWNIAPVTFAGSTEGHVFDMSLGVQNQIYWNVWADAQRIYRSDRYGGNMQLRNANPGATPRTLAASRIHPDLVYLSNGSGGNPSVRRSRDGGQTFPDQVCKTHPDGMYLMLYRDGDTPDGKNDVLFAGTDGGVARKDAGAAFFYSITGRGLHIGRFYRHSSNPVNSGMMTAGQHDNGIAAYYKNSPNPWTVPQWGDGLNSVFGQNGLNRSFTHLNYSPSGDEMGPTIGFSQATGAQVVTGPGDPPGFNLATRWWIPMKVDQKNILRVGKFFVYRYGPDGSGQNSWKANFLLLDGNHGEPKTDIGNNATTTANKELIKAYKKTVDFIISERQPNIGYIAYEDKPANAGDLLVENRNNLFRSRNIGNPTSQSWQKITPPVYGLMITDIEIDPLHPNRIWACYGGVVPWEITDAPENRKNRVYYSDNYGDTWTNVSKGLPMVPIYKILYVEGTDDVLFAGTDLGVYRWNKGQGIWQCFGEGMPKCIISEIEVNYCSGKLRASTFGRGIWESDIAADMGSYTPGYAHTINANTTWSSSKTVNGSILVKAGATFTISGTPSATGNSTTIYMPYKGKITVERGARLIIDGATLTNDCGAATPWYGIEVAGNNRRPATAQYQGVLELRNGALLQHARVAISNFDLPGYKCGGLIYASNSSINNCIKAVALNNTRTSFYNSGGTVTCSFNNVNFKKDDPAYPIDRLGYFSSWSMEKGVELIDCRFDYAVPASTLPYGQRYWAAHIQSTGAKVEKCSFKGFDRGIYATDYDGSGRPLDIRKSDFTKNTTGIMVAGNTYGTIGANTISQMAMPSIIYFSPKAVGIYLDRTQGAHVSGNSITSENKAVQTIGVLANNTRRYGTTVSHNSLFNLNRGFQSQGFNDAVTLKCNTFKDDKYGMAINPQWFQGGMGSFNNQGTGCNSYRSQADNTFSGNTKDIASYQVPSWKYYAGDQMGEMPSTWSGSVQVVPHCGGSTFKSSICSMLREGYSGLGGRRRGQLIEEYRNSKKTDETGRFLYGAVVNRHYEEDALPELIAFLAEENDPISQRLLLPLYMGQGDFGMAEETLAMMDIAEEEREAYLNYYRLLDDFTNNDRSPASITEDESQMLWDIIENGREPARFARALLEQAQQFEWEHPVDDMPADMKTARGKSPMGAAVAGSVLYDAQPNPARDNVTIKCHVADDDSYKEPVLLIRNIEGSVVYKRTLGKGVNAVPVATGKWPSGIYLYSLEVAGKERDTRKLSVVR